MESEELFELYEKIQKTESVLLLGQDYLAQSSNKNEYLSKLSEAMGFEKEYRSFNDLFEASLTRDNNTETLSKCIKSVSSSIPYQPKLRKILNLRWNMIYTTAVDNCLREAAVGTEFSANPDPFLDPADSGTFPRVFERKFSQKNNPALVSLFGYYDTMPKDRNDLKWFKLKHASTPIKWIPEKILSVKYGNSVLVIDGLSEHDWIDLSVLCSYDICPYSVYIFGMNKDMLLNQVGEGNAPLFEELLEQKVIVIEPKRFYDVLLEAEIILDDEQDENGYDFDSASDYAVTFFDKNKSSILSFSKEQLSRLDSHIYLLHDGITNDYSSANNEELRSQYINFLLQPTKPQWKYYSEKFGFYFNRTNDIELMETAEKLLNRNSTYNRPIILLNGTSNCGKTASLINFSLRLKDSMKPSKPGVVFFISGNPSGSDSEWMKQFANFIKNNVLSRSTSSANVDTRSRIENIIVVWDSYVDNSRERYYLLRRFLNDCNCLIVGSAYLNNNIDSNSKLPKSANEINIPLSASLDDSEYKSLISSIERFDKYFSIGLSKNQVKYNCSNHYIFDILNRYARYQDNDEIREALCRRLSNEVLYVENKTEEELASYVDTIAENVSKLDEEGVAFGIIQAAETSDSDVLNHMRDDIENLNGILAISGQFGHYLPMSLINRILCKNGIYDNKFRFLYSVLTTDSLLTMEDDSNTGEIMVRFRHPSEAIAYLRKFYTGNESDGKDKEIELLKTLIEKCDWSDDEESIRVLKIVRSFGPNSFGKYGDISRDGKSNYRFYDKYWLEISDTLKKYAYDNAEAMLVHSHFLREYLQAFPDEYIDTAGKMLEETRDMLLGIADNLIDVRDNKKKARMYGEYCSNLNCAVARKCCDAVDIFCVFNNTFKQAISSINQNYGNSPIKPTSKIILLAIWLVGFNHYYNSVGSDCDLSDLLSDTLHYIDILFDENIENISYDYDVSEILKNIREVFKLAKKDLSEMSHNSNGNDSWVFLEAKLKLAEVMEQKDSGRTIQTADLKMLYSLYESSDRLFEDKDEYRHLKKMLRTPCKDIIEIFNATKNKIAVSKSLRCNELLLKATWLYYTGNMILEEGQKPALTKTQWDNIHNISLGCIECAKREDMRKPPVAVFLENIYTWAFTSEYVKFDRSQNSIDSRKRIAFCDDHGTPRKFKISTYEYDGNLFARTRFGTSFDIIERKTIYIPRRYIGEKIPSDPRTNLSEEFTIWFNPGGPQIDFADQTRQEGEL